MPHHANALELLRHDHQQLQALLHRFDGVEAEDEQRALCEQIVNDLRLHTEIEEQVFYPYLRAATGREDLFQEASIEHALAKDLLEQLPREQPGTPRMKAMVKVLADQVEHHVQEEEGQIFPEIEHTGVDLEALGEALEECRQGEPIEGEAPPPSPSAGKAGARTSAAKAQGDDERFLREHGKGLSPSTQRAKWIHSTDDRPERDGQTLATRNLDVIRGWAAARKATPATTPGGDTERPRVLRFDFPGFDQSLQALSWDAWARTFTERQLVFVFQDKLASGRQSNFFHLDSPEREDG